MSPNDRAICEARAAIAFDLCKRIQVGRVFLQIHPTAKSDSLKGKIQARNKSMIRTVRKLADDIINRELKAHALETITFEEG